MPENTLLTTQPAAIETGTGSPDALWARVQERMKKALSQPSFETWILPLRLLSASSASVKLEAESTFNRDFVLKHYKGALKNAFATEITGQESAEKAPDIHISVAEAPASTTDDDTATEKTEEDSKWRPWTPRATKCNLNPRYTFENFVVGSHNRFPHAAALAVAETPAQSYNPFFIYGGVGLGKTHLMQAIGHFALRHHTDLKVRYVTAEQFTNDLINALGRKDMFAFRDRYRKIDILIIDDVQFLEGKERTQEEMFHTFNALHESGKQIILSSDRSPKHLSRLEKRLKSRFEWGLIVDIQPADFETRLAIVQRKAEREHLQIPNDVQQHIAEMFPNNIRELEGAVNKIAAWAMLTKSTLDLSAAQQVLGAPMDAHRISCDQILDVVADYYHLRACDLKSPSRAKDVSHARQVAIHVIRTLTESSFPKIGELLGGRKHTTILYAYEKIKGELETHPVLKQQITEITGRVKVCN